MTECIRIDRSKPDQDAIMRASSILGQGGIVAFSTDTVYGLGVNLLCPDAVSKVFELKKRPKTIPLPVMIAQPEQMEEFTKQIGPPVRKLVQTFWPGPLTIVMPCDSGVLAGQRVGFRVPDDPVALKIIECSSFPIACPSGSISGRGGPKTAQEILSDFDGRVDLVLDAGPCRIGKEATVVEMDGAAARILRHGYICQELIDTCLNRPLIDKQKVRSVLFVCTGNSCRSVIAEGLFNKLIQEKGNPSVRALSAGTIAFPGVRPSENAILVMKEEDVDISNHLSQSLTRELIDVADLVIALTRAHKRFILEIAGNPAADSNKVHLLMDFASRWDFFGVDVEDPIGQPVWAYRNCLNMMKDPIQRLVEML